MAIIDKPSDYFETVTYTASTSSSYSETSLQFQPDFIWLKNRDTTYPHHLFDAVRGSSLGLSSNSTDAEQTRGSSYLTSFDSNGFTTGNAIASDSADGVVAWNWKAGGTAVSNTDGSITSSVSANQDAGFSIVSYTSNGSASQTVGHGLGGVPEMIISKNRDSGSASYNYWTVYHHSLATANDKKLKLNTADAASTTNEWGDTDPTTTVYSLHTSGDGTTNHSTDKIISYCFRSIKGYSKISSYVGNGSTNGSYIHLGFKPAWVMVKCTSAAESWDIKDNKRNPYNTCDNGLRANQNSADDINTTYHMIDYLSNGFKLRGANQNLVNGSGQSYIYMAFAESPFVTSTGVPATAR